MAKEVSGLIKLQIKGGAANPSPPVGPALGAKGVNIMEFCKQFNARTQEQAGKVLPVIITVYKDKSFDFDVSADQGEERNLDFETIHLHHFRSGAPGRILKFNVRQDQGGGKTDLEMDVPADSQLTTGGILDCPGDKRLKFVKVV